MLRFFAGFSIATVLLAAPAFAKSQTMPLDDALAVTTIVQHRLNVADLDAMIAYETPYAVAHWQASNEHGAGSALVVKKNGNWSILAMSTSLLDDQAALERYGVPDPLARKLVADLDEK